MRYQFLKWFWFVLVDHTFFACAQSFYRAFDGDETGVTLHNLVIGLTIIIQGTKQERAKCTHVVLHFLHFL